jgi:uncharacterized protein (TIGR04255 family)
MDSEGEGTGVQRRYARAPIVEAVINIQVRYAEGSFDALLSAADKAFGATLPRKQDIRMVSLSIEANQSGIRSSNEFGGRAGIKFTNDASDRVLQIRQEGFAYSHLAPYTSWEIFSGEARPLWQRFLDSCQPDRVVRLAPRYINRLKLPQGAIRLEDYLNFHPAMPEQFGPMQGFMSQVQLPQTSVGQDAVALVTVASEPSTDQGFQAVVLDIDAFQVVDLPPSDHGVWAQLERLRDKKNELFEAALTDHMKGLIA